VNAAQWYVTRTLPVFVALFNISTITAANKLNILFTEIEWMDVG